jgi:hypothetical protein
VTWLAVILALLGAATFAISTSVQHQAAAGAPKSTRGVIGLISYLIRRPMWLLGQFLATCAFALHASALHAGPIALVQPIVVSGIVWAVPARAAISRRMPSVTELRAVAITAFGLAVFLVASNPSAGRPASLGVGTIAFTGVALALAAAADMTASRVHDDPRRRAFFLGVVGGIFFGLVAGFLKLSLQELQDGGWHGFFAAWTTYGVLVAGAGGVLTNQRAYHTAGLSASMPALNIVNGITSLAFGYLVFAEVPRHTPLFLVLEIGALCCMAWGLWMLVRLEEAIIEHEEVELTAERQARG